jgi:5-methylcytosine-specific restriction endonuclease McrA
MPSVEDRTRARWRSRDYMRRCDQSDVTPEDELAMRQRTRKCPLCGVYITSKPNRPNSKHLDHILPRNQGGNHVHGNVRIICADCNLKRPKDGSDYTGTLTLWAQGPVPVARPDRRREGGANTNKETCRKGLHPWIPANIKVTGSGKKLCKLCRQAKHLRQGGGALRQCKCGAMFPAPGRTFMCPACIDAAACKAAELHAGGLTWNQVAVEVGYGSGEGASYAAKRIGYIAAARDGKVA